MRGIESYLYLGKSVFSGDFLVCLVFLEGLLEGLSYFPRTLEGQEAANFEARVLRSSLGPDGFRWPGSPAPLGESPPAHQRTSAWVVGFSLTCSKATAQGICQWKIYFWIGIFKPPTSNVFFFFTSGLFLFS